jgi:hypothetical protein
MRRLIIVVFLLLVGCSYHPTYNTVKDSYNTYAPTHTSTYAPVYTPARTPTYVPVYPTRQVYGSPQKIKKVKKSKAYMAGGIAR